jgi:hypothetical protein
LPFWSAVLLGAFSLAYTIFVTVTKPTAVRIRDIWRGVSWGKVLWVSISFLVYCLIFPKFGYVLTTFLLIFLVMAIMKSGGLVRHGLYALIIAVVSFVIFNGLLDSRLPKGIFGF